MVHTHHYLLLPFLVASVLVDVGAVRVCSSNKHDGELGALLSKSNDGNTSHFKDDLVTAPTTPRDVHSYAMPGLRKRPLVHSRF